MYRCRTCGREETRGWLPAAAGGPYLAFLVGLSTAGSAGVVAGLRAWVGDRPPPAEAVGMPAWVGAAAVAAGLALVLAGAAAVKGVLELAEYLAFVRRRCPGCGRRRWSWGFTRGFGV
jgi:hypothetical protein